MREKSSECHTQASHVRAMTEMCSREPPPAVLQHHHPALGSSKANGKNPTSPPVQQQQHHNHAAHHSQSSPRPSSLVASPASTPSGHEDDASNGASNAAPGNSNNHLPTPGGRLKFFKDGKFILELSHRRDGERTTWFPVPKKTFWPPANVTPSRQESSASLSVSDDNSSIQSSPWQRDHCWKQTSPRRNISTEFNFYYRRNPKTRLSAHPRLIARKRRQPLDTCSSLTQLQESLANHQQQKQPQPQSSTATLANARKLNGAAAAAVPPNKSLSIIIDKLARLLDPNVVSPRKRILRELERVSLEDQASKRRATPPQPANTPQSNETPAPVSKQLSSYSITSILGEDKPSAENEPGFLRNLLKPQERRHPPQPSQHSPQHSRSPQHHPHSPQQHPHSPQHHPHSPQHQPVYPRSTSRLDPAVAAAYLSPNAAASSIHQPLYGLPMMPPTGYRAPPFCWMHYSQPVHYAPPMPLYAAPPQPPHHTPSPSPPAHRYKDYREQTLTPPSDMPLNLSKHAG
ncbi:protein hairless isoform X2 [Nasonia vitripennis]|uniref:Protein hairless n=1 Tax=Nasonia vitripennis TaxID=7425 RepID=A0A7M7H3G1_NASVI|nr:protein hairless isoform X2 [Nasonia vitripennis]